MALITVKIDFQKDLQNWLQVIQKKQSHGINWRQFIPNSLRGKLAGKNAEEITEIINSFLKEKYRAEKNTLLKYANNLQRVLNKTSKDIFSLMAHVTEKPMYRDEFTVFVTTFPRGPYNTSCGYVWMIYEKNDEWQTKAFIHEFLHMQFEHYYKEDLKQKMSDKQFEFLKESMTIIINKEFTKITSEQDKGYPIHQVFRKYLLELWEQRKSFNQFIEKAVNNVERFAPRNT